MPELSAAGKSLRADASAASNENHQHIGAAIADACGALRLVNQATAIGCETHYQLSNRVAFAWKLANLGVPTVLMYLGFIGDEGIADAGEPFRDDSHWHAVFLEYSQSVVPPHLFERRLDCGGAPAWLVVRSRRAASQSSRREA